MMRPKWAGPWRLEYRTFMSKRGVYKTTAVWIRHYVFVPGGPQFVWWGPTVDWRPE